MGSTNCQHALMAHRQRQQRPETSLEEGEQRPRTCIWPQAPSSTRPSCVTDKASERDTAPLCSHVMPSTQLCQTLFVESYLRRQTTPVQTQHIMQWQ